MAPPVIGASGVTGVWLNLGHGSSGWALSCGSARVLADLVANKIPDIDLNDLGIERLQIVSSMWAFPAKLRPFLISPADRLAQALKSD